jgi:hypothetical protein
MDVAHPLWKDALQLLLQKIYSLQEARKARHIVLRDFHSINTELDTLMVDNGFFRIRMPDTFVIPSLNWNTPQEFYEGLSSNGRDHVRKKVLRHADAFEVEVVTVSSWQEEIEYWYQLYCNVQQKSLELNTFPLPLSLFRQLAVNENWEALLLTLKSEGNTADPKPCCVVLSCKTGNAYIPLVIGIDYTHNRQYGIYRQALYQLVMRAKRTGKQNLLLGFSAGTEKHKLGAIALPAYAYMHSTDHFNMDELNAINTLTKNEKAMV